MAVVVETLRRPSLPAPVQEVSLRPVNAPAVAGTVTPLPVERKPSRQRKHELDSIASTIRTVTRQQRRLFCAELPEADRLALYSRGDFVTLSIIAGFDFKSYYPPLFEQSAQEAGTPLVPVVKRRTDKPPSATIALPAIDTKYAQAAWLADKRLRPFLKKEVAERLTQAPEPQPPAAATVESLAKLSKIAYARQLFLKAQETQAGEDFAAAMATVDQGTGRTLWQEGFITTLGQTVKAYGYTGGPRTIPHFAAAIKKAGTIGYAAVKEQIVNHYIPTQQTAAAGEIFNKTPGLDQYKIGAARPKVNVPQQPRERSRATPPAEWAKPRRSVERKNGAVPITHLAGTVFEASPATNGRPNPFAGMSDIPPDYYKECAPSLTSSAPPIGQPTERIGGALALAATAVDLEVIARAQAGDHEAFVAIFEQYQGPIYSYVYRLMGNREDAFDFTQDTLLKTPL